MGLSLQNRACHNGQKSAAKSCRGGIGMGRAPGAACDGCCGQEHAESNGVVGDADIKAQIIAAAQG